MKSWSAKRIRKYSWPVLIGGKGTFVWKFMFGGWTLADTQLFG